MIKTLAIALALAFSGASLATPTLAQQTDGCQGAYKKGVHPRCGEPSDSRDHNRDDGAGGKRDTRSEHNAR